MPTIVSFDFPPAFGGIQLYAAELARACAALHMPTSVVAPAMAKDRAFDETFPVPVFRFGGKRRVMRLLHASAALLRALHVVRDRQTIAMSWFPAGLVVALLPRRWRGNLTVIVHGTELGARSVSVRAFLRRFVLRRADRIAANSAFTATIAQRFCNRRIDVVHCGVKPRTVPRRAAEQPTALFVGRLISRKGADRTIEALALVRAAHPTATLEIVGEGPQRAELERLSKRLGIADAVIFSGALSDEERDAAFGRAWCLAMPSRSEGSDVEGFGIVYLEAAVAAIPAIGGAQTGAEDAIVNGVTGFLVDGRDPADIASALRRVFGDPLAARAMGEAARKRALADFSWNRTAEQLGMPVEGSH